MFGDLRHGISMNIFGSSWKINYDWSTMKENDQLQLNPGNDTGHDPYPFGLDPLWQVAQNKIIFLNSFKMKLSIIFGVTHMVFGVCMSVINFVHFRNKASILLEFLPQILFLLLLFAYMVFLMFFKWFSFSSTPGVEQRFPPGCAPSILNMFINMMLFKNSVPLDGCNEFMFEGQELIQKVFICVALVCIPWMLLGKPLYIMCIKKSHHQVSL